MRFNFITLFPHLMEAYFSDSILHRAIKNNLIQTHFFNPREFTANRYKKVDAPKIGGGAGMLLEIEPIEKALEAIKKEDSFFNTCC